MNSSDTKGSAARGRIYVRIDPITVAGLLAAVAFVVLVTSRVTLPEWLNHLLTSVIVVAIVHLLDRYVFIGETRSELQSMNSLVVRNITGEIDAALKRVTDQLNSRTDGLLSQTRRNLQQLLLEQSAALKALNQSSIRAIYTTRAEASPAISKAITKSSNTELRIIGISINDFLRGDSGPALVEAWRHIQQIVTGVVKLPDSCSKMRIRVLILDPRSFAARLRSWAEMRSDETRAGRLENDVIEAARALQKIERLSRQHCKETRVVFEARLYTIAPTVFVCHVDEESFVEPYHFWTERLNDTPIPVLEYSGDPAAPHSYPMHLELASHFDTIWNEASVTTDEVLDHLKVGIQEGAGLCGLVNIFGDPRQAAQRMAYLIEDTQRQLYLQGVSLRSFFSDLAHSKLRFNDKIFKALSQRGVKVNILILDPDCEQAIFRAYREMKLRPANRNVTFEEYVRSGEHARSKLKVDTERTLDSIAEWVPRLDTDVPGWEELLHVNTYKSSAGSFTLLTDTAALIEQYNYGKIAPEASAVTPITLGTDMPLMEYSNVRERLYADTADPLRSPYLLQLNHLKFVVEQAAEVDLRSRYGHRRPTGAAILPVAESG